MTSPEKRLVELGLTLPAVAPAAANYVPYVLSGRHLFIAGQIPFLNGEKMHIGRLGDGFSIEQGQEAARACALNILAQVKDAIAGDWTHLVRCVKLGGFVNATPDFDQHPAVINGASDLLVAALGEKGKHARFAVGASNLPFGVSVEVDAVFEIRV
ncbi:MAG: RidA family protein [Alphaproteobacteria bacterium]|jgi:enamine deaminase RidA (YjgF/YER057c/UK114 family)|nr:RidA family protein [Alphaproteobacteria bacterium]MCB1550907.1 RidA family protein [Alphaproteobacteria bacterium]MCB9985792.1 RidA family protein [Micavibrio sp.]HPQ51278.1 RidA family protein [Alphaproteobacteria bacterium]HRK97575.1 RidA family protein [Alphaproteobacteria bacterium]